MKNKLIVFQVLFSLCVLATGIMAYEVGRRIYLIFYNKWKFSGYDSSGVLMVSSQTQYTFFGLSAVILLLSIICNKGLRGNKRLLSFSVAQIFVFSIFIVAWVFALNSSLVKFY